MNDLLSKCYDVERGYTEAAKQVEGIYLKQKLMNLSQICNEFGHAIKEGVKNLGGQVECDDTLIAKLHRGLIDIRSFSSSNPESAVLNEVVRGEKMHSVTIMML